MVEKMTTRESASSSLSENGNISESGFTCR